MHPCEIIYVEKAKGWKWRTLEEKGAEKSRTSPQTFQLFYECVSAARAAGLLPNVKCP